MPLHNLINTHCVAHNLRVSSKKQLLQEMVHLAENDPALKDCPGERDILAAVLEREKLGTTGIGSGVAIPHARIEGLCGVSAAMATLEKPIGYDAVDDRPVDIVVLLLAPQDAGAEHLRALAQVSRVLRREDFRERLRSAPSVDALRAMIAEEARESAA